MANITITIPYSELKYQTWLRTSYIASSIISGEGEMMINQHEFGADQKDLFIDLMREAGIEVLKVFESRQGDVEVANPPYSDNGTDIIYAFKQATPILGNNDAIVTRLQSDVADAIYSILTFKWYTYKKQPELAMLFSAEYDRLRDNIHGALYKLHD